MRTSVSGAEMESSTSTAAAVITAQSTADEQDLPASLQRDLDAYQKGLAEHVSYLDCLWCELYGSINSAQWSGEISEDQARCLREKYLF